MGLARAILIGGVLALGALVTPATAQDRRGSPTQTGEKVEEILVTGEHPGPGMWQVSNGDNTLWVLGTYSPLPTRLIWRSEEVEFAISEAQQVLASYSGSFALRGGNPLATEGKPLRKVLSRKEYSRWIALKAKYIGKLDEVDRALPVTAALILRSAAFARTGLTNADGVSREMQRVAAQYHVPVTSDHQVTKVVSGAPANAEAERKGVAFLVRTMNTLETDLRAARVRANAWAVGDIEALRAQAAADTTVAQLYAGSWPYLDDAELAALTRETDARWLEAAERALRHNRTTVATLPIFMLLDANGLLSQLRARGFEVIEPVG